MLRHLHSIGRASLAATLTLAMPAIGVAQDAPIFQGSALLILSDTDMPASAFVDGKLVPGSRDRLSAPDTLTVLSLPVHPTGNPDPAVEIAELPVSNSVVGPPYAMAASPDKRTAYVLETRGPARKGTETVPNVFTGLPANAHVTVVDIANPSAPKVIEKVEVGHHAHTLSLRRDGRMLAINTTEPGRTIILRSVGADGRIGAETAAFGVEVDSKPVRRVGRVEWHPSGQFLALGLSFEDEIRFYRVMDSGGRITIAPWGEPVKVGDFPDEGAFTPDGRHYKLRRRRWACRPAWSRSGWAIQTSRARPARAAHGALPARQRPC
jgi:hypothetical protein